MQWPGIGKGQAPKKCWQRQPRIQQQSNTGPACEIQSVVACMLASFCFSQLACTAPQKLNWTLKHAKNTYCTGGVNDSAVTSILTSAWPFIMDTTCAWQANWDRCDAICWYRNTTITATEGCTILAEWSHGMDSPELLTNHAVQTEGCGFKKATTQSHRIGYNVVTLFS